MNQAPDTVANQNEPTVHEWLSVKQAGMLLACSDYVVLSRCLAGDLTAQRFGGRWFVTRESVELALANEPAS